jgi:hypothetical protein
MNISFCSVVLSLIQGIALNTDVPPCPQGWGVTAMLMKPCGQKEARNEAEQNRHRAATDLAGARRSRARSSSAIPNRQRGLGLGLDRGGR